MEDLTRLKKRLRLSCEEGSLSFVKSALKKRPDLLESTDNKGTTLLGTAFKHDQAEVVNYLLRQGADINTVNNVYQETHTK